MGKLSDNCAHGSGNIFYNKYRIYSVFLNKRFSSSAMKELIKSIRGKNEVKGEGTLSAFQALCTALSSCVGNGNIVGVATAIAGGGPGAVFWMWAAGILGTARKYAEIVIGMIYREKAEDGTYVGGPMYYLSKGLGWKKISVIFAALMCMQVSGGCLIQSNAVASVAKNIFNIRPVFAGIIMGIIIAAVVIRRSEKAGSGSGKINTHNDNYIFSRRNYYNNF